MPLTAWTASLLLLPSALAAGLYSSSSPVLQVDARNYESLIGRTNHTSIVEFYAPWCGHCQNLKPAYEKAAKSLSGLAKVAAINCDDEPNKPLCGSMGVQGFPTLKIVKPGSFKDGKKGKPSVEDYQGARSAKAIVDAVVDKIPNHVKRLTDKDFQTWLENGDGPKAILFSDKSTTSATLKAISVDFLGGLSVAQIRDKDRQAVEVFGIDKFPSLVLLPGGEQDPVFYNGEMKKSAMKEFLSQAVAPNPDPAPTKEKTKSNKKEKGKSSKAAETFSKASASQASRQAETAKASQTLEDLEDDYKPTASPGASVADEDAPKPLRLTDLAPPIPSLKDDLSLQRSCLNSKASTCILVLLSTEESPEEHGVVGSLSEIHHKYASSDHKLFTFYQVSADVVESANLRNKLGLVGSGSGTELVAVNGKRSWYRHYAKPSFSRADLEDWIDSIRMGDGAKSKLPEGIMVDAADLPPAPIKLDINDPEAVREAMAQQNFQEGVDFQMEEIDDAEYERLLAEASRAAMAKEAQETATADEHDEL